MIIPYQYNKMAAGATVSDPNRAIAGNRGVFTDLRNGSCLENCIAKLVPKRFHGFPVLPHLGE